MLVRSLAFATMLLAGCSATSELRPARYIADEVTVVTQDAPGEAYRRAVRALVEVGYPLLVSDEALRTATTDFVPACQASGRDVVTAVQVSVLVGDGEPASVTYRALYRLAHAESRVARVRLSHYMTAEEDHAWAELTNAAGTYPGGALQPRPPSSKPSVFDC